MKFLSKAWNFSVKAGLVMFIWTVMLVSAIAIFSLTQKGTVYYGNRCNSYIDQKAIDYLNQEEIIAYDYEFNCNTLYLDLNVKDDLNKDQIIAVLVRISNHYNSLEIDFDTQVTIKNASYLILASLINDGSVSLSVSEI